jgi:RimJ/RimL family protein N-acetyltransferase
MKILETDRLILRQLNVDDDEFIYELVNDPSFIRYIGDKGVRTRDDARNYILNGPVASYEKFGYGLFATELKDGNVPIGMCGILKRDTLPHADIGFAFLPRYWNKGYAFEAAAAVMKYAGEVLGMDQVLAITTPDNEASGRLLEKIGLRFERMIKLSEDAPAVKLFTSETKRETRT